jgi:hypothetical protein
MWHQRIYCPVPCQENGFLYHPISGRKNDITLLTISWVNHPLFLLSEMITEALVRGEDAAYFNFQMSLGKKERLG